MMETEGPQAVQIEGLVLPSKSPARLTTAVANSSSVQKATLHKLLNEPMLACTNSPQNRNLAHSRISKNNSNSSNNSSNNNNSNSNIQKVASDPQNSNPKETALSFLLDSDKPAAMDVDQAPAAGEGEKVVVEKVVVKKVVEKVPLSAVEENCSSSSTNSSIVNRFQTSGFQNRTIHGGHHLEVGKSRSAFHSIASSISSEKDASSYRNLRDRSNRKPIQERPRQKRQTLQDMTRPLKVWLYHHRDNPYPSKSEKVQLTKSSQMTMTQVSNWFANARRRLKNTVRDPELTWAKRIKLYNSYVEGNQELLSIGSSSSSSSSSSSDDDLHDDLTEQDGTEKAQGEQKSSATAQRIQEENGGQHQQTGISNNSALADQGIKQADNLLDRLSGNTHMRFESLSTEEHATGPCDAEPMDQTPQVPSVVESRNSSSAIQDPLQRSNVRLEAAEQSHPVHQPPSGTVAGFGDVESSLGDCTETAPKYKTNIMQRYLNDSYQSAMHSLNSLAGRDLKESERHRNPSGSLSSHDYEEYMSSASSARSTPTREHQEGHVDEYEEYSRFWPDIKSRAEDDLYWKEISAALALTSLARSRYSTQSH